MEQYPQNPFTIHEGLLDLLPDFTYEPLLSTSSIRLLEIHVGNIGILSRYNPCSYNCCKGVVVCSLHQIDLDDPNITAVYDALSYTWGNPFSVFRDKEDAEKADILYATEVPIICNGMVLRVGRNLYEAMLSLRMTRRSKRPLNVVFFESGPMSSQFIWIDAICIDQRNLMERNSQVQMMDRIYRTADIVHIWLGQQDSFSETALKVIMALFEAPSGSIGGLEFSDVLGSSQSEELGIEKLEPAHWHCLFAFLERRWFRRAWVVQEVALSKLALINAGTAYLAWDTLVFATLCLRGTIPLSLIWEEGVRVALGLSASSTPMYLNTNITSAENILERNPISIIHTIAAINAQSRITHPHGELDELRRAVRRLTILDIMNLCCATQCQDPRDHVYAFLSLWPSPNELAVDYSRNPAQVFTDAANSILRSATNLSLLSHAKRDVGPRTSGLPSWVPDWGFGTTFHALEHSLGVKTKSPSGSCTECPYNASGGRTWQAALCSESPNLLKVQGRKIGTVIVFAKFDETNLETLQPIIDQVQPFYVYWKICSGDDAPLILKETFEQLFPGKSNLISPSNYHARTSPSKPVVSTEQIPGSNFSASIRVDIFEYCAETPIEAIWRTLIADVWQHEHPAPVEAGLAFTDLVAEGMRQLLYRLQKVKAGREEEVRYLDSLQSNVTHDMSRVTMSLVKTAEECDGFWSHRIGHLMSLSSLESASIQLCTQLFTDRKPLVHFLPQVKTNDELMLYVLKQSNDYLEWHRLLHFKKMLFCTSSGNIGSTTATTIRTDDEIWVLAGSNFPMILRPLPNGHYQIVGEAYVRGIMHGEALWVKDSHPSSVFVDIILE